MAIAFNRKSNVVDGNVERVFSRFYAVEEPIEKSKIFIWEVVGSLLPPPPDIRHSRGGGLLTGFAMRAIRFLHVHVHVFRH